MRHLTEAEFVDLVDATLAPSREAHLDSCDDCRAVAARMREALTSNRSRRDAGAVAALLGTLLRARARRRARCGVRRGIDVVPLGARRDIHMGHVGSAAHAPARSRCLGERVARQDAGSGARDGHRDDRATTPAADAASDRAFDAFDPDTDQAWALVRTVADDVSWDDAEAVGFGARPGSAERAMATLTTDERSELVRLLQAETKQPGA